MKTQVTQPSKEMLNERSFFRKSIISDAINNNERQIINHTGATCTRPAEITTGNTIDHQKNSFMKTFIRKGGMIAIVFVIANLFFTNKGISQTITAFLQNTQTQAGTGTSVRDISNTIGSPGSVTSSSTSSTNFSQTLAFTITVSSLSNPIIGNSFPVSLNVSNVSNSSSEAQFRVQRLNSSGVVQASSTAYSAVFNNSGTKTATFTFSPAQTWATGDRLVLSIEQRSTTGGGRTLTVATGNANSTIQYTTASISTSAITGSPFCITPATGASVSIPFTSGGTYTSNTYTAQLSNAAGSFASPTAIGTLVSNANSGTISANIPANTASGTGYRIRVVSSSPAVTGTDNGSNLTINLATASVAPGTTQNINVGANGTQLTVTESLAASSRQWFYGTNSGGPYSNATGIAGTTFTPNFAVQGTYYIVCVSNFACGTVTSNQVQVNVLPSVTTGTIAGSPFCITSTVSAAVAVPFTSLGVYSANSYTAQLSNASGSFASPTTIGTLFSNDNSGTINAIIPANTPTGTGYRIRVMSSNPAVNGPDNGSNLTINLSINSVTPGSIQNIAYGTDGNQLTVIESPVAAISREWLYGTTSGGPYDVATGITSTTFTPNFGTPGTYYVVCRSTYECGTATSNQVQVNALPAITTSPVSGSPFCITAALPASLTVSFTSNGTYSDNTFTVQLSNATGSFASPVNIGTLTSDNSSETINATIPANTPSGTGYRIRVVSSSPQSISSDNGTDLTINLSANSIVPTTENINVGVNGTQLTVTESPTGTAISREWFYGTTSGGPYDVATGITTTTYTPNFSTQGTYYVVCVSTFACGSLTSNQAQINVSAFITTGAIAGSPFCAGAAVSVPFTSAGTFIGNTYTAQLSNASGSFASPTNIGTLVSDLNSGTIDATIPAGTPVGSGYLIRVIADGPITTGSSSSAIAVTTNPTVNFVASATSGTTGAIITFTDQSTNIPTSWSWSINGGPEVSNAKNPAITFNTAGTFSITLTATNACGSGTLTRTNYITITALTMPAVFNSSGSFTVPPGVTCIKVEAWGGGGAGGGATRSAGGGTVNGGGGAGGAYASSYLNVTPSNVHTVTVAGQKTGTVTGTDSGDPSWFGSTSTVFAQGGNGGSPANNGTASGGTGSSGSSIGATVVAGTSGANGNGGGTGSIGGAGANGGGAGGAGITTNANGNPGIAPGGGGSGARTTNSGTFTGGAGGAGRITVSWVDATDFHISATTCVASVSTVTVTSNSLATGNYTVTYNTTNPDNTGLTATMSFNAGTHTGSFSTIALTGPVSNLTVTGITFTGWTCSAPINSNNTATVNILPTASISYTPNSFCVTDDVIKVVTEAGQAGGTYSATPAGLSINASTGEINPSLSTTNTYTVRYDFTDGVCSNFTTTTVIIGTPPVATFNYPLASYCQYLPSSPNPLVNPSPAFTGGGIAGTFSASPAGLNFVNVNTGQINLATTAPGDYTITNTVSVNGCTNAATFDITISALPAATISYSAASFCHYSGLQTVNLNAATFLIGSYSASPAGLTINGANDFSDPNAGQIDPSTSAPGTYIVTYTYTDGTCSNTATTTVVISAPADVAVAAQAASVCTGTGTNITVANSSATTSYQLRNNADNTLIGSPVTGNGGTINLPTGALTSATTFNVLATVTGTGCFAQLSATATVTIKEQPTASAGGSQTICSNGSAIISGASSSNGTILWTHNGAGSLANATTLAPTYTPSAADGGNTVTLTMTVSNSPCIAATATYTIFVNPLPAVSLSTSSVCIGSTSTILSPVTGGTWISNNPTVATVTNDGVVTAVAGGTATFTFTSTATNCSSTTSTLTVDPTCQVVTLSQPAQLSATISGDAITCPGQLTTITVTVAGGTAPYKVIYNSIEYTGAGPIITFNVSPTGTTVYSSSNVSVTDAHSCNGAVGGSATVSVTPASSIVLQSGPSNQAVCNGLPIATITYALGGTSTGASISAGSLPSGVNGGMDGNNFVISGIPSESGSFNFTITTAGPCPNSITGTINVNPSPVVSFSGLAASYCLNITSVALTGNQTSGTFTGNGITDHGNGTATFNPNEAGPGTHTITYTYTNASGCTNSQSQTVTVNDLPVMSCPANSTVCLNSGPITLSGGSPSGGSYSGTGVSAGIFDPVSAGVGDHLVTYSYTDVNGCTNTCSFTIKVVQLVLTFNTSTVSYCQNDQPAALTVIASGGIPVDVDPAYFYQWQQYSDEFHIFLDIPGETGSSYQPPVMNPGTYTYQVRVIDQCGELFSASKTIIVNTPPVINGTTKASHNGSDLTCATSTDGEITVDASGALPLLYSSDNGANYQSSNVFTGLGQGTYHIVVKDNNGCVSEEATVSITAPEVLNVGPSTIVNVTCHGGNDGSITLGLVTGGTPPYKYVWTKTGDATFYVEGTTANLPELTAGTYNYNVTDANNCANVTGSVTILQPEVAVSKIDVACNGNSTGSATVTITGTAGPFDFVWRNGSGQIIATESNNTTGSHQVGSLPAGTYQVSVSYPSSCTTIVTVTIAEPAPLSAQINLHSDINCVSATSGSATVSPIGGTAPYSYLWDDVSGQTTATATGLTAGFYTVTVTDHNGCTTTASVTIVQNPAPVISNCPSAPIAFNTDPGLCNYTVKNSELDIQATDACPITYTYTLSGATTLNNIINTLGGTVLGKGTTHISCVASDGLQSSTCSFDVVVSDNEPPVITCPANITINCQDAHDPDVNTSLGKATANDNCSAPASIVISILSDISTQDPDASAAGHYNYTITRTWKAIDEAGQFSTCQQIITVHDVTAPTNIVIPADVTVTCASLVPSANDAAVTANDNCSSVTVTHQDVISNNTCVNRFILSRTYTVTDVSGNAASMTQTITVFDETVPVITSCPPASVFCYSTGNSYAIPALVATDNCGTLSVTYHITGATSRDGNGNDASGLFAIGVSTIEWTVKDACNNTATCSTTVTVYPIPATPVINVTNNCGASVLSTNAPGALLWNTGETTSTITVNTPGIYTVTSTINGCTSDAGTATAAPILVPPAPVVNVQNNCDGTSVLSTTATGNLLWSNFSTGPSITVFTGGTYSVTQSNSCYTSAPGFGIAAPTFGANTPTVSIVQPTCSTPTGTLTVTSPTTTGLTFSIDGVTYQSSPVFPGLVPNTYNVRVRTAAGCLSPAMPATINAQPGTPPAPVVTVENTCNGTSILSTTATGTLLWSTGASGSSITVSTGGSFSVTQTVNGCSSLPGSAVAAPNTTPIAPILSINQPNCTTPAGSILVLVPTGAGLEYGINGANYQASPLFNNVTPGNYTITVRNAGGCTSTGSPATILPAPGIPSTPEVTVVNNCNGTSTLSTTATGTLLWSTGASGPSITVNTAGAFSVTQTVNGCVSLPGSGTAAPNSPPAAPTVITGQPNCTTATGTITITAPTGASWTYSIDGVSYVPGNVFSGLVPDNYNVTAKNAAGCVSSITAITINNQPATPAPPVIGTITQPTCTIATGSVVLSGLPAGNWVVNPGAIAGNAATITVSNLTTGVHNFTVTNAAGCISSLSLDVTINPQPPTPLPPIIGAITQPTTANPTGSVVLNGLPAGNWVINPGGIAGSTPSTTVGNLAPNTFNFFTVTNSVGCTSPTSAPVFIDPPIETSPPAPIVGTIIQPTCTTATGTVTLNGLPSTGTWTLTRSPGNVTTTGTGTSATIPGLAPGTYTYTVTGTGGTSLPSANVVINPQPTIPTVAAITGTATVCAGGTTQLADLTVGGVWSVTNGTGSATVSLTGLVTGINAGTVTVNYAVTNSCGTATVTRPVTVIAAPTATISYAAAAPANQLLAMPLNEGAGTSATDISGNVHNGTLTSGPTWVAGKYGQAVNFNGTTNYINIPDHNDFTLSPSQNYTWSAWVRNTNFNQWSPIWSQTIDANNFFYFYAHTSTDAEAGPVTNGISVYWYNGANKLVLHSNNNVLSPGVWSHIAVTYNGSLAQANRFTIYVNGVDVTNRADVVSAGAIVTLNPTNIRIGSDAPFNEFLNGAVDEMRFYSRLLTGAEITTDMNTPLAPASNGTFCPTGTASVIQTGQTGGTYSSTPGLSINATTGAINLAASTPGNYTITYGFTNGTCPGTATANVVIAGQATSISYAGGPFCQNGTANVTLSGQAGGTYSSTAGLSINSTTGAINLAASTAGTYTVTYSYGSASCSGTATTSVVVTATPATNISYAGSPFCQNGTVNVTQTGQAGGTYTSTAGLSINATTGAINLAASTVGTYTVTYSFSNGNCSGTATTSVTINALPTATINYVGGPFCQSGTANVTLTGQAGGTYTSTAGLSINATTGAINLAASTIGTYTVTYSFGNGSCANTTTTSVTIVSGPTAAISYVGGPFCQSGTANVTQTGQAGGTYTSTAGLSIAAATGAINLAASTPGTYTVTYSFTNGTCGGVTTTSITINSLPAASIVYAPATTANQLVAMPLNEGAGTSAADISGRSHNGTLTGGPTWTAGKYGQAVNFNGTTNYINIPDHNDFTLTPAQSYTWSAWVKNTNFNQWSTVWSQTIDANNFFYFYAHTSTDAEAGPVTNGISVYWYNGANKLVLHSNNNVLTAGNWSHVAVTYNGSLAQANRFTIYVNGVDVTNRTDVVSAGTIATLNPTNIRIGSNQPFGEFLNGAVDEVRFYNRLLAASEVQTDMNTAIAPFNGSFCQSAGIAPVTQTGQAGGTYSSTAGLSINAATGAVNLPASTPGTYTVTYGFSNGICSNTTTTTISVVNCGLVTRVAPPQTTVKTPVVSADVSPDKMETLVYPNPTLSFFNLKVKTKHDEPVEIRVYDMLGKTVQQQRGAPGQIFRLGDHLAQGVYVVEVRQAGQSVTTKLVKKGDDVSNNYF